MYRRNIIRVYIFVHCSCFIWLSVDLAEKRTGNSDLVKNIVYTAAAYKAAEREWLDDGYEFVTHWDVRTMLEYYSGIITPTALGNLAGIHPKQLWSYLHGYTKPRKKQVAKIEKALHQLGKELMNTTF